jgi:hypothetical protein
MKNKSKKQSKIPLGLKRLLKVTRHLERGKLVHKKFDFGRVNDGPLNKKGCGTLGCAMGELPDIFPRDWGFDPEGMLKKSRRPICRWTETILRRQFDIEEYFNITKDERLHLFYPDVQKPYIFGGKKLGRKASRKAVAKNIRAFVSLKLKQNL